MAVTSWSTRRKKAGEFTSATATAAVNQSMHPKLN
jgi:hypothetical protein